MTMRTSEAYFTPEEYITLERKAIPPNPKNPRRLQRHQHRARHSKHHTQGHKRTGGEKITIEAPGPVGSVSNRTGFYAETLRSPSKTASVA